MRIKEQFMFIRNLAMILVASIGFFGLSGSLLLLMFIKDWSMFSLVFIGISGLLGWNFLGGFKDGMSRFSSTKELFAEAEAGDAAAQDRLGYMYELGDGVPRNLVNAYMWYSVAADQENEGADDAREHLSGKMTWAEISQAQRLSRECLAQNYQRCGL